MKKIVAIAIFKLDILPLIPKNDKPAQRMAWNNWTDSLCKDGVITMKQYNTWVGPVR